MLVCLIVRGVIVQQVVCHVWINMIQMEIWLVKNVMNNRASYLVSTFKSLPGDTWLGRYKRLLFFTLQSNIRRKGTSTKL